MAINLNLMRSLQVLVEECHVSRAAERLHITQSAMSRQLSQLRTLFDDPLLVRDGNRLLPTPRAQALKPRLDALLQDMSVLVEEKPFDPLAWREQLVLASSDYVGQYIVPELMALIGEQAPQLQLQMRLWQPQYLERLIDEEIHFASTVMPQQPEGVYSVLLGQDRSVCVMRRGHPLAQKAHKAGQAQLSLDDMLQYSYISISGGGDKDSQFDLALTRKAGSKVARHIALKVPFFPAAFNALCKGDYLLLVPEHIAANLTRHWPITHQQLPLETPLYKYWLLWHERYQQDPGHRWLRQHMARIMSLSEYAIGAQFPSIESGGMV